MDGGGEMKNETATETEMTVVVAGLNKKRVLEFYEMPLFDSVLVRDRAGNYFEIEPQKDSPYIIVHTWTEEKRGRVGVVQKGRAVELRFLDE